MPLTTDIKIEHVQLVTKVDEPHYHEVEKNFYGESGQSVYNIKKGENFLFNNVFFTDFYHNI